jgi:ABC-2 type transport system ATP-binding protein
MLPELRIYGEALYAYEFLAFQARIYGLDEETARLRVAELLEAMELAGQNKKPIAEFSSGMRKRVAFSAAIIARPEILFLDEPFESIDPAGVAIMKGWLGRLIAQGRTVFITTHVLDTVERLCDRIAIIKRPGHIVWEEPINSLGNNQPVICQRTRARMPSAASSS